MTERDNARESLDKLGQKIQREREAAGLDAGEAEGPNRAMGEGFRVAIELVVSVFVGAGLGFLVGNWLDQKAIGTIIGMGFGFAAGLRAVYKFMMEDAAKNAANEDRKD